MPILKERKLEGTQVGNGILAFGTWGELCPVLAWRCCFPPVKPGRPC